VLSACSGGSLIGLDETTAPVPLFRLMPIDIMRLASDMK